MSADERFRVNVESVRVEAGIDAAIAIGLIVNELLHNAVKYAVPGGAGKVSVALGKKHDHLVLSVSDNGPGLPSDFNDRRSHSMGIELTEILVRDRLQGTIAFTTHRGAICRAVFPVSALS